MKEKHRKKTEKSKGVSQTIAKGWEGWGKLVKNGPEWQKILSVTLYISREPYITWLPFMVYMCKIIICPGIFSFLKNVWFSGSLRGKRAKKWGKSGHIVG